MDIKKTLLKGQSKEQMHKILAFISADQQRFNALFNLFMEDDYRITQRAAWPLSYCVEAYPALIKPHWRNLIRKLKDPSSPIAVKRNGVRLLQFVDIPGRHAGAIADLCYSFLTGKEPVAVKVFAMTVLSNIAQKQPELKNEIRLIIEDQLPYASPGFQSRAKRVLKSLKD